MHIGYDCNIVSFSTNISLKWRRRNPVGCSPTSPEEKDGYGSLGVPCLVLATDRVGVSLEHLCLPSFTPAGTLGRPREGSVEGLLCTTYLAVCCQEGGGSVRVETVSCLETENTYV